MHDIGSCHRPFSFHLISSTLAYANVAFSLGQRVGLNKCKTAMWQCHNHLFKEAHSGQNIIQTHSKVLIPQNIVSLIYRTLLYMGLNNVMVV